jgi:hypothetical protein
MLEMESVELITDWGMIQNPDVSETLSITRDDPDD